MGTTRSLTMHENAATFNSRDMNVA